MVRAHIKLALRASPDIRSDLLFGVADIAVVLVVSVGASRPSLERGQISEFFHEVALGATDAVHAEEVAFFAVLAHFYVVWVDEGDSAAGAFVLKWMPSLEVEWSFASE